MANEFLDVKVIARLTLQRLIENMVFPNLIYRDFSNDFQPGKGAKIQVKKPVVLEAKDFDETNGVTAQDIKESSVEVTLDKLATVDAEWGAIAGATSIDDLNRLFIEPSAVALAEKINSDGLFLYKDIPYIAGAAGTTPASLSVIADARKALNINKVPLAGRVAVWDPEAEASLSTLDAVAHAEKSASTDALREGELGRLYSFNNFMAQGIKTHTAGTLAVGGGTTPKIVPKAIVAEGATGLTLAVTGGTSPTLTGTLVKGDILTIKGKTYTVVTGGTAASDELAVTVYPALPALAVTDVITVAASHTANLGFAPQAFAFVTRPLTLPSGVEAYVVSYNGVSMRVVKGYDIKYKKETISMDVLYGYKTMYQELAVRILG
ncbi:P22 phage major capsid protein family protein [Acetobacterium sp.]|uniref:P22 phage major capsid protein family protein n=1 Tax=Acetobacterium sp. TaxID=1872094 RepID=UPI0027240884|nr:P22 phage major capsid protein family protein [Acetobacterium sp.]MDO9492806.1 P22 phage major capsid protein family protein [Acetobacterium sp.]